jgi:thymidylate synthase ThyX
VRCQEDAQKETRDVCWDIDNLTRDLFPVSWPALR